MFLQALRERVAPAAVLIFLSPVIAELLTSSSPPVRFFTPFGLVVMTLLYGSGALLARELTVRWGKGWPTLVTLGAAYGILEEGLMVRSFFDPLWPGIGLLGSYGRLVGVNWVWSIELTIFHALFSITIPNVLLEVLFPRVRGKRLAGPIGLSLFGAFLAADVVFGGLALTKYSPPLVPFICAIAAAGGLCAAARLLPIDFPRMQPARAQDPGEHSPLMFFLLGLGVTTTFFLLHWMVPGLGAAPLATVLLVLDVTIGLCVGVWLLGPLASLSRVARWGLCAGALSFFVVLAPLIELDGNRTGLQGMAWVGLGMAVFLGLTYVSARRKTSS